MSLECDSTKFTEGKSVLHGLWRATSPFAVLVCSRDHTALDLTHFKLFVCMDACMYGWMDGWNYVILMICLNNGFLWHLPDSS